LPSPEGVIHPYVSRKPRVCPAPCSKKSSWLPVRTR